MTYKEMIKELRKHPLGKDLLTRAYRIRGQFSSKIHAAVEKIVSPDKDMLVMALVMNTQNMGLDQGTYVELAPIKGMLGPCRLSGTSLPLFEYKVFHAQPVMEFIKVQVEVARPDRIFFKASIDSKGTADDKDHGKEMEVIDAYMKPFFILAHHLYNYFPHWQNPICRSNMQFLQERSNVTA